MTVMLYGIPQTIYFNGTFCVIFGLIASVLKNMFFAGSEREDYITERPDRAV